MYSILFQKLFLYKLFLERLSAEKRNNDSSTFFGDSPRDYQQPNSGRLVECLLFASKKESFGLFIAANESAMEASEQQPPDAGPSSAGNVVQQTKDPIFSRGFEKIVPICHNTEPHLQATDMPFPRSGHRLVANDRYAVALGGYNPSLWTENNSPDTYYPILKEVWVFNLMTLRWTKFPTSGDMPKELASHAALLHDNYIIVYGGTGVPFGHNSTNKLNALNMQTGLWRPQTVILAPDTTLGPPEQYGHAFVRAGKKLYITGGTSGFEFNMQVFELESIEGAAGSQLLCHSLLRGPELSPRYRHEAFVFLGKLHAVGGGRTDTVCSLETVDVFDIATGLWSSVSVQADPTAGFPAPRRCHGLAVYEAPLAEGRCLSVYICGGYDGTQTFDDVWELQLSRQGSVIEYKWRRFPHDLPRPLHFHGMAATPNGCLLVFGGVDGETDQRSAMLYRCWLRPPPLLEMALRKVIMALGPISQKELEDTAVRLCLPQTCVDWIRNRW